MREIITVQVGSAGNAIGEEFLNVICGEHGIDCTGKFIGNNTLQIERVNVFFNEGHKRYYARAVVVDTDQESVEKIRSGPLGCIYMPNHFIQGHGSTGNNYAKGYTEDGKEILNATMNAIRLEAEASDSLQGVQVIHALGGGTGSGLSALIWEKLIEEYKENITQTVSIIPSPKLSSVVVEPYNCILTFPHLLEHTQLTFCIDNEALYDICINRLNLGCASYRDANHLIAHAMSGVTTCLRFPGQLNTGLRKLYVNMVPFPNLHFLVPGFAPLSSCDHLCYEKSSVPELVTQIFSENNMYAAINLLEHKLLTVAAIFRGLISPKEVDLAMQRIREKHCKAFVNWIPSNVKTAICDIPPMGLKMSATFIGNTTGITKLFTRVDDQFVTMYNRKAYLHWYTEHGMEEQQFEEARMRLQDVVQEYEEQSRDSDDVDHLNSDCCFGQTAGRSTTSKGKNSKPDKSDTASLKGKKSDTSNKSNSSKSSK